MTFLQFLWFLSIILSTLAIGCMLILVVRRMVIRRQELRRETIRKQLLRDILAYQDGELSTEEIRQRAQRALPVLADLLSELTQIVRGSELDRLINLFEELGLTKRLLFHLKRGNKQRRITAATNLRYTKSPQAVAALEQALDDSDPDVRLPAANSLTQLAAPPPLPVLIEKLCIGQSERSQTLLQIFQVLAEIRPEELLACLQSRETDDFTRTLTLTALGKSGHYGAIDQIIEALTAESLDVRAAALRALADLQHPAANAAVLNALSDEAWEVRTQAANCAGRLALKDASSRLNELLDDANWWTRYRAALALYELGEAGRESLSQAAVSGREHASRIAAMVLAERTVE